MKTVLMTALLITLAAFTSVNAQDDKPNWAEKFPNYELLGEKKVDFGADKDTIEVGAKEGRYVSLMIGVIEGNLEMWDIKVTFGNDETYSPEIRAEFKQGERSRQIDLPGEARVIKEVTFKYKSKLRKGKATVKLFGKPADAGDKPGPDKPETDKGEWKEHLPRSADAYQLLGQREVDFKGDNDTIHVGRDDGRFTAIVIGVTEGNLVMYDVVIEFVNGETHSPKTRLAFEEKTRSREISLPGDERGIKKVTFKYESKGRDGKATVKLFGKPAAPEKRYAGYKHLAAREVDFGKDTDVVIVGESKGTFKGMMIEVENADLDMREIVVTFGNGKQHEVETRIEFNEGSRSRAVDFPGGARTVERIVFKYSTEGRKEGKATVNVYGKE
ncbi:MAG: hypothetical protein H6841_00310 [Planctomycetes bacterium]|nr:hypothetical protein [Planctomycetota bacterium]MCB9935829.1 hypothetical protein [Planctomycetota bacterium]